MATETHTGRLVFGDGQVAMEDGTVLAVRGPNPCATAAGRFAKWGQTQPVTVTGTTGTVDNSPVLYATSIDWAAETAVSAAAADSSGRAESLDDAPVAKKKVAVKKKPKKLTRSRSKK